MNSLVFPGGKRFAFTILDDTDLATVEKVGPVYELLASLGFRTTKTVWPLAPRRQSRLGGATLADVPYADFVRGLHARGFEIAFHGATSHSSVREETREALERFKAFFGDYPKVHCNHSYNQDNIYWGAARLASLGPRLIYRLATVSGERCFDGHNPDSPYFWGDLCQAHVRYVRNFVYREVNLLKVTPVLPYHDETKPYVNQWFTSTEAPTVDRFCEMLTDQRQRQLEDERGVCILYAHLACGFAREGAVDPRVRQRLGRLASRNGWFVPVSELLDYLGRHGGGCTATRRELASMEWRWMQEKLRHGSS
ncbi:MAG: hypothetical protein NTU94_09045 [Planctomycetota bacterium]|nr:hypothetical protein [Planctomycetota bacterium]